MRIRDAGINYWRSCPGHLRMTKAELGGRSAGPWVGVELRSSGRTRRDRNRLNGWKALTPPASPAPTQIRVGREALHGSRQILTGRKFRFTRLAGLRQHETTSVDVFSGAFQVSCAQVQRLSQALIGSKASSVAPHKWNYNSERASCETGLLNSARFNTISFLFLFVNWCSQQVVGVLRSAL